MKRKKINRRRFLAAGMAAGASAAAVGEAKAWGLFHTGGGAGSAPPPPPPQTIASVTLSGNSFVGGSPDGTPVGAWQVTMSPPTPPFSGTLAAPGGTDAARFKNSSTSLPSTLELNGAQPGGTYSITETVTQPGISNSPFTAGPFTITGGSTLILSRTFNNPATASGPTPNPAFVSFGHPFMPGELPAGLKFNATLGGVPVRVGLFRPPKLESGSPDSYAHASVGVDFSSAAIAPGTSQTLVLTPAVGSWATTSTRLDADWINLGLTVALTAVSTTGTPAVDMDATGSSVPGSFIAYFDGTTYNTIEVLGTCDLGRRVKVTARPVTAEGIPHAYLTVSIPFMCWQKDDGTLGAVSWEGPWVDNIYINNSTRAGLKDPAAFLLDMEFFQGPTSLRCYERINCVAMSRQWLGRIDGKPQWSANDPGIWIGADYTVTRKTQKIPPYRDGINYVGNNATQAFVNVLSVNTTTGVFTVTANQNTSLFSDSPNAATQPSPLEFFGTTLPTGVDRDTVYWGRYISVSTFSIYNNPINAMAGGTTGQIIPSSSTISALKVRLAAAPIAAGFVNHAIPAAADHPFLGIVPENCAAYHVANTEDYQRWGRVNAIIFGQIPQYVGNSGYLGGTTGMLPSFMDAGHTPASYGAAHETWYYLPGSLGGWVGLKSPSGGTNYWAPESAHNPSPVFTIWMMEDSEFLRELILLDGNRALGMEANNRRNGNFFGTQRYGVCGFSVNATRIDAWNLRSFLQASFAAAQNSDDETYFSNVINQNLGMFNDYVAFKGANFLASGFYVWDESDPPNGVLNPNCPTNTFMAAYMSDTLSFGSMIRGSKYPGIKSVNNTLNGLVQLTELWPYAATTYTVQQRTYYSDEPSVAGMNKYVPSINDLGFGAGDDFMCWWTTDGSGNAVITTQCGNITSKYGFAPRLGDRFFLFDYTIENVRKMIPITAITWNAGVATVSVASGLGMVAGSKYCIVIRGSTINGNYLATATAANTFTVPIAVDPRPITVLGYLYNGSFGTAITGGATWSGGVVTVTTWQNYLLYKDWPFTAVLSGCTPSSLDGTHAATWGPGVNQFQFPLASDPGPITTLKWGPIVFIGAGKAPAPFTANTYYYVANVVTDPVLSTKVTCNLSATLGGALIKSTGPDTTTGGVFVPGAATIAAYPVGTAWSTTNGGDDYFARACGTLALQAICGVPNAADAFNKLHALFTGTMATYNATAMNALQPTL